MCDHSAIRFRGLGSVYLPLFFKDGQVVDGVIDIAPRKELADKLNTLIQTR